MVSANTLKQMRRVSELATQGMAPGAIAKAIGVSPTYLYQLYAKVRQREARAHGEAYETVAQRNRRTRMETIEQAIELGAGHITLARMLNRPTQGTPRAIRELGFECPMTLGDDDEAWGATLLRTHSVSQVMAIMSQNYATIRRVRIRHSLPDVLPCHGCYRCDSD